MQIRKSVALPRPKSLSVGENRPYAVLRVDDIDVDLSLLGHLEPLLAFWPEMPRDEHTASRAADGLRCSRSRTFSRVELDPKSDGISKLADAEFRQGENNVYAANVKRRFAPVPPAMLENPLLLAMIRFTWQQFQVAEPWSGLPWEVGIHAIRTHGVVTEPTHITPEGPHSDGFAFVAMWHMLQSGLSADSAVTQMFLGEDTECCELVRLTQSLDVIFADDKLTRHFVTALRGVTDGASRDVLVLTWHQNIAGSPYRNRN